VKEPRYCYFNLL